MTTTPHPVPAPQGAARRLTRRSDDRMLAGVCSGLAEYTGIDVTVVRLLAVLIAVLGFGSVVAAYAAAWLLVPLDRDAA